METTQKKKLTILSILGLSSLSLIVTAAFMGKAGIIKPMNAMDCTHETVGHYYAKNALDAEIEHWACCQCHTAWADEGRTIEIGNTVDDRSKISFETLCRYQVQWDANLSKPVYDAENGFVYRNYLSNLGAGESNAIETTSSGFTLEEKGFDYFGGIITNKTSSKLTGPLFNRAWGGTIKDFVIEAGESRAFVVSASDWKATKSGDDYGFAFLLTNETEVASGSYVELSKPMFFNGKSNFNEFFGYMQHSQGWVDLVDGIDATHGLTKQTFVPSGADVYFGNRVAIDTSKYMGVKFSIYNGMDTDTDPVNIYNIAGATPKNVGVLKAKSWNEVTVPAEVWNGDDSQKLIVVQNLNSTGAIFKFADFQFVEKGAPYVCFGDASDENITYEPSWAAATKTTDAEKGKIFSFEYPAGAKSFATNHGKMNIDTSVYSTVEFYVYNGTDSEFTMYSTPDWAHNAQYGTIAKDAWTLCSMPASDFNIKATIFFYPSGNPVGTIKVTYFVAK